MRYSNKTDTVFIPLKTESGIRSRTNVVDVVVRRRRPKGRVAVQLDDECHTCSTSRLHRLAAKKILPSDLRISGAAEVGKEDSKDPPAQRRALRWRTLPPKSISNRAQKQAKTEK